MSRQAQKKALLLTDVTAPGGVDTYVVGLYDAALRLGWNVAVAIDRHQGSDRLAKMLCDRNAPTVRLPLYHRENAELVRRKACETLLGDVKPTIMHAVCGAPWTTIVPREVALDRQIPMLFTEQFVAPGFEFEPETVGRIRRLYCEARSVIAVSNNNCDLLSGTYGFGDNITVIPNPVPRLEIAEYTESERNRLFAELGVPQRAIQAVTVARCAEQKGLDVLIEALAQMRDDVRERFHVSIIGDGPDRTMLGQFAVDRGVSNNVTILGWRDDVSRIVPAFDLFVLPSRSEGQPFALTEALALKRPVIATAVSGIPELLDNGNNGLLVKSESPGDLARAIESFVDDPTTLRTKAETGYQYVRTVHDAKTNFARTIALWETS